MTHDGATSSGYALDRLNYMGIPIIIRNEWTEIIQWQAGATPTVYDKPHRAVLTYDGNKPLGTCDQNKLKEFKTVDFISLVSLSHIFYILEYSFKE